MPKPLNKYQFRTHPLGAHPALPDSMPNMWRTDIVEVGPVKDRSIPQGGRRVGFLEWEQPENKRTFSQITEVKVDPDHQRQGLATEALRHAQRVARASGGRIPEPLHSSWRTPEGDAWARSTGDYVPPNEY